MGKILRRIVMILLIVACLFNIVWKLVHKLPIAKELQASAEYIEQQKAIESEQNGSN